MTIDTKNKIAFTKEHYGEKSVVMGITGSGKSYGARVLVEEGLEQGVKFVIIDPQGAYDNLNNVEYVNAKDVNDIGALGALVAMTNRNIVIRIKELNEKEQNNFLKEFFTEYTKRQQKGIKCIVIDEVHKFLPQTDKTASKSIIRGMIQENRSDGLGIILVSQMPARIDKTAVKQSSNKFIGYMDEMNDIKAVRGFLVGDYKDDIFRKLETGNFYCKISNQEATIFKFRKAKTKHSGDSPTNLLSENTTLFNEHYKDLKKFRSKDSKSRGENKMTEKELTLPSKGTVVSLAGLGVKISLGMGVAAMSSRLVTRFVPNFSLGPVSSRTIVSASSTVVLFMGHRLAASRNLDKVADVLKYASAGAAAFTMGSVLADAIAAAGVQSPLLNTTVQMTTGVQQTTENAEASPDLDTAFA